MGGLSLTHWLVVLVVVVLIFGTKRLRNVGQDLGEALKGFRRGMRDGDVDGDPGTDAATRSRDALPPPGPNDDAGDAGRSDGDAGPGPR